MTQYQGKVQSYVLDIQSPNSSYNHKSVISLHGAFGLAILYFVPQDGPLRQNQKRAGQDIFDIYYWMDSWPHLTCATRSRCRQVHESPPILTALGSLHSALQLHQQGCDVVLEL